MTSVESYRSSAYRYQVTYQDLAINLSKISIVQSEIAGQGKTTYINLIYKDFKIIVLYLSGNLSHQTMNERLDYIAKDLAEASKQKVIIHVKLEMVEEDNQTIPALNQIIFRMCYVRCLPHRDVFVYFDKVDQFVFEISSDFNKSLLESITMLSGAKPSPSLKGLADDPKYLLLSSLQESISSSGKKDSDSNNESTANRFDICGVVKIWLDINCKGNHPVTNSDVVEAFCPSTDT